MEKEEKLAEMGMQRDLKYLMDKVETIQVAQSIIDELGEDRARELAVAIEKRLAEPLPF